MNLEQTKEQIRKLREHARILESTGDKHGAQESRRTAEILEKRLEKLDPHFKKKSIFGKISLFVLGCAVIYLGFVNVQKGQNSALLMGMLYTVLGIMLVLASIEKKKKNLPIP